MRTLTKGMLRWSLLLLFHLTRPRLRIPVLNESSMGDYCRFVQVVLSMPPMDEFDVDFYLGVEQVDGDLPDKVRVRFVLEAYSALWR